MSNEKTQWKLVPYEPTQGMIYSVRRLDPALPLEHIRALWWSMWGAAPGAPSAEVVPKTRFTADQREHQRVIQGVDKWLSAYNLPTYSALATPAPEVPADRAALADDECDKLAAQTIDRVAVSKGLEHGLHLSTDIASSHTLRRELIRAGFSAALAPSKASAPMEYTIRARFADDIETYLDVRAVHNIAPGKIGIDVTMPDYCASPVNLAAAPEPPGTQDGEALTSPFQPGRFKAWKQDINDLHSPWFLVVPGGDSFPFNHNADDAVDCARAMWVAAACNAYAAGLRPVAPEAPAQADAEPQGIEHWKAVAHANKSRAEDYDRLAHRYIVAKAEIRRLGGDDNFVNWQRTREAAPEAAAEDTARLDWLLPNLHPANFGMDFPGGYEWEDETEYLSKWREAIDAARITQPDELEGRES